MRPLPAAVGMAGRWARPSNLVALVLLVYLGVILARGGGDPLVFVQLGDGFSGGRPLGREGYDGQFAYAIALDPRPEAAAPHLDVPAYRYQRILYPLLAWLLAGGQRAFVPWTLVGINLLAQVLATRGLESLLQTYGVNRWYALTYGLWAGLVLAVRLDLTEPVSFALVVGALITEQRGRRSPAAALLGLAVFAKETALVYLAAAAAAGLQQVIGTHGARRPAAALRAVWPYGLALLPYLLFQAALRRWFGVVGLASGGYMATPFEWIPFMGLWQIGLVSVPALILFLAILGPMAVWPSVWGIATAARRLAAGEAGLPLWALLGNASIILFAPHSTFREPLGMARLLTGLVLATLLYGARARSARSLRFSLAWLAALALLRE